MDLYTKKWAEFVRTGDPDLFQELYQQYYFLAKFSTYGILHHQHQSEDIVQDTFYKLFEKRKDYPYIQNFSAYLSAMIRYECFRFLRKQEDSINGKRIDLNTIDKSWERDDDYQKDQMHRAIGYLNKKNHKEIILACLKGKDNYQISKEINKSEKYVRDTKVLAKKELKRIIFENKQP